jgi:hypothetical protein
MAAVSKIATVLVAVSLAVSCTPPFAQPSPSPSPTQSPVVAPASPSPAEAPRATPTPRPPVAISLCDRIVPDQLAQIIGHSASTVSEATTDMACTYRVGDPAAGTGFDVIVRTEDAFDDLEAVRQVFSDGHDVEVAGTGAYWVPMLPALWFNVDGDLHAVQLIQFDEADGDALALSTGLAELLIAALD